MWSDPEVIKDEKIRTSTNQEVARRMRLGGLFYVVCCSAITQMSTALSGQFQGILFISIFIVLSVIRFAVCHFALKESVTRTRVVEHSISIIYIATATTWSLLLIWIFTSLGVTEHAATLAVIATVGFIAGGIAATAPRIRLMLAFGFLIYIPGLLCLAFLYPNDSGWILIVIGLAYFTFTMHNGKLQHDNYWAARQQTLLLEKQAIDLERAHQQAVAANKAKSAFLATMSHEIRTPMNGVLGMTEILASTALTQEQKNHIDVIRNSGKTLLRIIDDVLDLAKLEAHKLKIVNRSFDLESFISEIEHLFTPRAKEKSLDFIIQTDCPLSRRLIGDPDRIKQILFNLLGNAFKFTQSGEIRLIVQCSPLAKQEGITLQLTVSDTGIGISPENQKLLFQEFIQVGESSQHIQGTGLGLVITRNLLALMGGKISITSQEGKGSQFTASIPLRFDTDLSNVTLIQQPETPTLQTSTTNHCRVLLVEDNEVNQIISKAILKQLGCEITLANDGQEAIKAFSSAPFDLILMDCNMPIMDGFEATQQIRNLEHQQNITTPIPIIALTAHAFDEIKQQCLDAGMNEYLSKPFDKHQLAKLINQLLPEHEIKNPPIRTTS